MASDLPFHALFAEPTKNGLTRPKRVRGSGVYMVNMGELFAHRRIGAIPMDRVPLPSNENSFLLEPGDLLFARQSLVLSGAGQCSLFLGHNEPVTFESHLIRCRIDKAKADPRFLFYFFGSPAGRAALEPIIQQGAGASGLRASDLAKVSLPNVPLDEQRAVSNVLSVLDDRIDHNRALAANLEAIARALFKSWFVDFDPVRAKAAGEAPPGLAPNLAVLFPDRFVDSELGEIPEGWKFAPLSQLVEVERGLSYKGAGLADRESGKPMHNLNSVLEGGGYKYTGIKFYSGEYKPRHIARAGDIVVANTEQGHKHLLIGFPAIIPASHEEGLFSHHLYRVRLLEGAGATKHWLYYALMAPEVREQIIGHANGSTVNMLKPSGLQVPLVVLPPLALCEQFDALAESFRARIENCVAESTVLAELRDLLLPRLISGKLRVEDAEAALEAA